MTVRIHEPADDLSLPPQPSAEEEALDWVCSRTKHDAEWWSDVDGKLWVDVTMSVLLGPNDVRDIVAESSESKQLSRFAVAVAEAMEDVADEIRRKNQ